MIPELKIFLKENRDKINQKDFKFLYDELKYISAIAIKEMTEMFLTIGVDPAEYLEIIPQNYLSLSKSHITQSFCPDTTKLISIDNYAFLGCLGIEEALLPEGLQYIGASAFFKCANLNTLDLPKSLTKIDKVAFYECEKLKNISFNGTIEEWKNVNLTNSAQTFYRVPVRKIKCLDGEYSLRH